MKTPEPEEMIPPRSGGHGGGKISEPEGNEKAPGHVAGVPERRSR